MSTQGEKADRFLALHHGATPLLMPNAWDAGTAALFASLGFQAIATTSSGHAATLGRLDGAVTRDEALEHVATLVAATDLPVSADFENGFADDAAAVAANVTLAAATGLAGCSIEDFTRAADDPIYPIDLAAERVAAAAEAAHGGAARLSVRYDRQQQVARVLRSVKYALLCRLHLGPGADGRAGVEVAVEAREIGARHLEADAVSRKKCVARLPQRDRVLVGAAGFDRARSLQRVAAPRANDAFAYQERTPVGMNVYECRSEVSVRG